MLHRLCGTAALLCLLPVVGTAQIAPNSSFFAVQDYYVPNTAGDYVRYRVAGFAQPSAPNISPTLFLLPTITVSTDDVRFFRPNGTQFTPTTYDSVVGSMTITPRVVNTMPNDRHIPGIAAVLEGRSLEVFPRPSWKGANNQIPMRADAQMSPIANEIRADYTEWDAQVAGVDSLAARYRNYQKRMATLNEVEVELLIGGATAAARAYSGSTTSLGALTVLSPTQFQVNQVRAGNYELLVRARFPDMKTSFISANFDAVQAVKSFVEETQSAITKSKSSGFQVFHIGSRRNKMKTSINQSLRTNDQVETMQNTSVVMYDASEDMVRQFESDFFPELAQQEVVDRHLNAADSARRAGNLGLAKLHQDYAEAITQANQLKEVDAVAAAAALNQNDFAGFLAHGVRSINSNDQRANNFRRVVHNEIEIRQKTSWNQTRQVTVLREVSVPVSVETAIAQKPWIGSCGFRMGVPYTAIVRNQYGQPVPQNIQGLVLTCVMQGAPLGAANLLPGSFIYKVGSEDVTSLADLDRALDAYDPGDTIPVWVAEPTPGSPFTRYTRYNVVAKAGAPRVE